MRHAGFVCLGMISGVCQRSFRSNLANVMQLHSPGLQDENPRVRYQALMSMSRLMNYQSPEVQKTYHAVLMPLLLARMAQEDQIKMKAQVVSCAVSFVNNMTGSPYEDSSTNEDTKAGGKQLIMHYSNQLVESISVLFQLSIDQNYQPLQ